MKYVCDIGKRVPESTQKADRVVGKKDYFDDVFAVSGKLIRKGSEGRITQSCPYES